MDTQKSTHALAHSILQWLWRLAITLLLMLLFCNINFVIAQPKIQKVPEINKKLSKARFQIFRQQRKFSQSKVELFSPSNTPHKDTTVLARLPFCQESQKINVAIKGKHLILEGDILLSEKNIVNSKVSKGVIISSNDRNFRWENGVIPYVLADSHPQKTRIEEAIEMVNDLTQLRITPRAFEKDFLEFIPDSGCASYIGRIGGKQKIYVDKGCQKGSIVHELFHAAGLFHEHTSPNRDEFVEILWENIKAGKEDNFALTENGFAVSKYDYASIMHYPAKAFGKVLNRKKQVTIKCKGTEADCAKMGQRNAPTHSDIDAINLMYRNTNGFENSPEWNNLEGKRMNVPRVVSSNVGQLELFAQGLDSCLYHRQETDDVWGSWQRIEGKLEVGTDVSPVVLDSGHMVLLAKGMNDNLYCNFWIGENWSTWKNLEVKMMANPTAISRDSTTVDVFVQGMDSSIVHLHWDGFEWQSLEGLGRKFPVGTKVTAISQGMDRIDVFVWDKSNRLFHKHWDGKKWQGWNVDKQRLVGVPKAIYRDSSTIDLFVRNEAGEVLHKVWNDNPRIGNWKNIGGKMSNDAEIQVIQRDSSYLDLFVKGADRALWHTVKEGQSWQNWQSIGGNLTTNPQVLLEENNQYKAFSIGQNEEVLYVEFSLKE